MFTVINLFTIKWGHNRNIFSFTPGNPFYFWDFTWGKIAIYPFDSGDSYCKLTVSVIWDYFLEKSQIWQKNVLFLNSICSQFLLRLKSEILMPKSKSYRSILKLFFSKIPNPGILSYTILISEHKGPFFAIKKYKKKLLLVTFLTNLAKYAIS